MRSPKSSEPPSIAAGIWVGNRIGCFPASLVAAKGANSLSVVELFVETGERERLAALGCETTDLALEKSNYCATESAAAMLERTQRASRLLVHKCYLRVGLAGEWEDTVRQIRTNHDRETAFMAEFDRIVTSAGRTRPSSFPARATSNSGSGIERGVDLE
jgi:hypothetical protein